MKRIIALAALSAFALAACKDDTQAQLQAQQKQIEALQQQLTQQNQAGQAAQDDTVYQLNADAVASTIPAEFQNGNNGEPVTGTDGQQYVYDQSSGSWLLQSLIGAAAGAMLGNMLANGFKNVTTSVNLNSWAGLVVGDVLLNVANHTAIYVGNGQICLFRCRVRVAAH